MARQRIIMLLLVVCFSLTLWAAQPPSYKPPRFPPRQPGMSREEYQKEVEKALRQQRQDHLKEADEYINLMGVQAWQYLLGVTEGQWNLVEPKYKVVASLVGEMYACALASGGEKKFRWYKHSEGTGGNSAKEIDQMTEGQKIADELIDLLEDPNSTDDQIRKKIDALQQVRENARKALPKAKQELAGVLTTPRQEAVFLIHGYID